LEQLRGYFVEMKIEIRETKEMGGLCAVGRSFWSAEGKEELPWAAALFFKRRVCSWLDKKRMGLGFCALLFVNSPLPFINIAECSLI
jgi:hypothetical protein